MTTQRREYADDPSVEKAGKDSWEASKATWEDAANPTSDEEVAAKNARLAARVYAAQALVDAA